MIEVVLDTNVLVAALRSRRGASHELIRAIGDGVLAGEHLHALALEYEEVVKRLFRGGVQFCGTRTTSVFWKWLLRVAGAERFGVLVETPGEFLSALKKRP